MAIVNFLSNPTGRKGETFLEILAQSVNFFQKNYDFDFTKEAL